jgi:hypothetical protein
VHARDKQVEGKCGERCKHGLNKRLTPTTVLGSGAMHSMQQLRGRDRGDRYLIALPQLILQAPRSGLHGALRGQVACGALKRDENSCV